MYLDKHSRSNHEKHAERSKDQQRLAPEQVAGQPDAGDPHLGRLFHFSGGFPSRVSMVGRGTNTFIFRAVVSEGRGCETRETLGIRPPPRFSSIEDIRDGDGRDARAGRRGRS